MSAMSYPELFTRQCKRCKSAQVLLWVSFRSINRSQLVLFLDKFRVARSITLDAILIEGRRNYGCWSVDLSRSHGNRYSNLPRLESPQRLFRGVDLGYG